MSPTVNRGSSYDSVSNTLQDSGRDDRVEGKDRPLDGTVGLEATWGTHLEVWGEQCPWV